MSGNPSIRHTTFAAFLSHPWSQTAFHSPLCSTSTLPSWRCLPPLRRIPVNPLATPANSRNRRTRHENAMLMLSSVQHDEIQMTGGSISVVFRSKWKEDNTLIKEVSRASTYEVKTNFGVAMSHSERKTLSKVSLRWLWSWQITDVSQNEIWYVSPQEVLEISKK